MLAIGRLYCLHVSLRRLRWQKELARIQVDPADVGHFAFLDMDMRRFNEALLRVDDEPETAFTGDGWHTSHPGVMW